MSAAAEAVRSVGGKITNELGINDAVAAEMTAFQVDAAYNMEGVSRIYDNRHVEVAKKPTKTEITDTIYPSRVGASRLHAEGITGRGVTVAVLDTGWDNFGAMSYDTHSEWRVLESYDAIQDNIVGLPRRGPVYYPASYGENDANGHATHVTSIILSKGNTNPDAPEEGLYDGIAPDASLVVVKAFDAYGQGRYADVIRGIDWVVTNKDTHNIRILNCSFSAPPRSHY
jgi:subtilisin family serine protease